MENCDRNKFELSRLVAVLEKALDATTRTKKVLYASCDGAQHLLSNWHIPDDSVHEEPPHCTCGNGGGGDDDDDYSRIHEVAKTIEQVVEQAQKLRETVSFSRSQPRSSPLTKRSNTEKMSSQYGFGFKKLNDKIQKKSQGTKLNSVNKPVTPSNGSSTITKRLVNTHSIAKSSADNHSQRMMTNTKQQSIPVPMVNRNYDKKAVTKPRLKSSPSLQTTYQKDFSTRKICNTVKRSPSLNSSLKPKESSMKDENAAILCSKNSSSMSFSEKIRISDLEDLLCRATISPNVNVASNLEKSKRLQMKVNSCLLHADNTADTTKKAYRVVGLAEAVDVLGVPSDLLEVLKTYHCFLAESQAGKKCGSGTFKKQSAAKSFLNKLSTMNGNSWNKFTYEPLVGLFLEYMALVSEVSVAVEHKFKDMNDEIFACLQEKCECLEKKHHKWSNVNESVFTQQNTPNHNGIITEHNYRHHISTDGWATIGIWNSNSRQRFKALGEMQCIRYSSEVQWKKYEANVQEIQILELQTEVYEVLESFILPQLFSYNPQDHTFPYLYKTVCSLCNMALLTSPLIIKSC